MTNQPIKPIPERVLARKKELGISYEKIAERLTDLTGEPVKWQSVAQYAKGENNTARFMYHLAAALDTTPEELGAKIVGGTNGSLTTAAVDSPGGEGHPAHKEDRSMGEGGLWDIIGDLTRRLSRLERAREEDIDRAPEGKPDPHKRRTRK